MPTRPKAESPDYEMDPRPAGSSSILEIEDLTVRFYVDEGVVHAVNGVSLALGKGETLALVGESGCGKSVTMLAVMGLIPQPAGEVVSGSVVFDGQDLSRLSNNELCRIRGKDLAMVFQDPMTSLNPVMKVGRQIEESLIIHLKLDRATARTRAVEMLDLVGIPDPTACADDYPHQFSGGMRQRVMIAMALCCEPRVLIADEPTTALDVTIQAQVASLVKRLQRNLGMAVVWITHDLGLVARLADRVAVMYAGRIVERGGLDDIFQRPHHPYTWGLLRSVPRMDRIAPGELVEIPGAPPDCIDLPPGCVFAPRCDWRTDRCISELPQLATIGQPDHRTACWQWREMVNHG